MKRKQLAAKLVACQILAIILLTGCGYTAEEKAQMRGYEKQAMENAAAYIEQKYGFEPTVLSATCDKAPVGIIPDFTPDATGDVYVKLRDGKLLFSVYISGEETTVDGIDNYQVSEICQAVKNTMEELTGCDAEEGYVFFGEDDGSTKNQNGMVQTYFDGSNLEEVLAEGKFKTTFFYVEEDLSQIDMDDVIGAFGEGEHLFVSYNSREDFDVTDCHDYKAANSFKSKLIENGMRIKEYRLYDVNGDAYEQFDMQECDGFYYKTSQDTDVVQMEATDMPDASNWNGKGFRNARQVMDAYTIVSDTDGIRFYIPVSILSVEEARELGVAIWYRSDGEEGYKGLRTTLTEDKQYVTAAFTPKDYDEVKVTVLQSGDES